MTVRILGNNALKSAKQQSARTPIRCVSRFDTVSNHEAECVDQDVAFASLYALVRVETTSATTLGRLDRLAIHDHHRWTLPVRHDGGPARRALDVDGPTHRSFARLESNGRPCHRVEILVATVATGSRSAGGKRWRSGRHEVWW